MSGLASIRSGPGALPPVENVYKGLADGGMVRPMPSPVLRRFLEFYHYHPDEADKITAEEWARRFGEDLSANDKLRINNIMAIRRAKQDLERDMEKDLAKRDMEDALTPSEYREAYETYRNIPPSDVDNAQFYLRDYSGLGIPYSRIQRKRPNMLGSPGQ